MKQWKNVGKKIVVMLLSFTMSCSTLLSVLPEYIVNAANGVATVTANSTTKSYNNIKEAWEAVKNGGTISLNQDWNAENEKFDRLSVNEGATVTIKLNGHIINRHIASIDDDKSKKNGEIIVVQKGATVTIDGGDTGIVHDGYVASGDGVWYENAGSTSKQIKGGVIAGGYSKNGAGGIHIKSGATVTLNNVTIAGNKADEYYGDGYGGGIAIYGEGASLTLNNSKIQYNYAQTSGGGISVNEESGNIKLNNRSEISYNKADDKYGGGVYFADDQQKLKLGDDCKIECNEAKYGGGIYSDGDNISVKLDDTAEIASNKARKDGGGAYFNYSKVLVKGGKIHNNIAQKSGGAIYLQHYMNQYSTDSVAIANTEYTYNEAKGGSGGAIHTEQENTNISACTFHNNMASDTGGAIFIYNDYCAIASSEITNNTARQNGGGVYIKGYEDVGLSGKVTVTDNKLTDGTRNNFTLAKSGAANAKLSSSAGAGSKVGITISSNEAATISSNAGHYVESVYFSDKANQYIEWGEDRKLYMRVGTKEETPVNNVDAKDKTTTSGGTIKGYFSYPSVEETTKDLDGVYYYSDSYFKNPGTYNNKLATMSICLAMSAFNSNVGNDSKKGNDYTLKAKNVVKLMTDIGIKKDDIYLSDTYTVKPGTGTIGVAIGQKKLDEDGTILVPIAVRGAGYESEWSSNVTIGDGSKDEKEHAGFADAANQVFSQVKSYIEKYDLNNAVKSGKVKFWVTGYSRAGATSNLTAKRLIDAYAKDQNEVYGYCMEAPQGAYTQDGKNVNPSGKYNSIHNCINYNDPVPKVAPVGMKFARYGVDHVFNNSASKTMIASVKQQLKKIAPDMAYDDYYHVATFIFIGTKLDWLFCDDSDMLRPANDDQIKNVAPKNGGDYTDELLKHLQEWAINNREDFTTVPEQDLRKDKSLQKVSFEKSLQLLMPIVFSKSDKQIDELAEKASQKVNDLGMTGIYFNVIRGDWNGMNPTEKKKWIWSELWDVLVEPSDGDGIAAELTSQELIDLKTAWPTLLDTLLKFVNKDYKYKDWVSGIPVAQSGLNILATLAYNATSLMQAHYPEVNYAWLRSEDSNYNNESSQIKMSSTLTPTVNYSLDKESYNGDQVLKLDTKSGGTENGAAIFYKLTTSIGSKTSTSSWKPYNKQILLPAGVDEKGDQITANYKVETKTALADKSSESSKEYTINAENPIKINVVDQNGDKIADYACAKGKNITIPATQVEGKFFVKWSSNDITIDEKDKNSQSITFTMPEDQKDLVTIKAKYLDKINQIDIQNLKKPSPSEEFSTKANVILTGKVSDTSKTSATIEKSDYSVAWVKVEGSKESIVTTQKPEYNADYKAVIVLKPENGVCEYVDTDQFKSITVNGEKLTAPTINKQSDGSYWIFTDKMTTEKSDFESAQDIAVKAKTGTSLENITLPESILIKASDGYKIASIKKGTLTCSDYNANIAGTYSATAEIDLTSTGVKETKNPAKVNVMITLEGQSIAEVPVLDKDSAQDAYKGTKTIKFTDVESGGTIKYKVETVSSLNDVDVADTQTDDTGFKTYDKENGIKLTKPDSKGTSTNYKVTAYTSVSGKADSAKVTFLYRICNPYSVTINYTDTGLGNPWSDKNHTSDTYTYFPEEEVTIVAPEIEAESFDQWKEVKGITLDEGKQISKSIQVGKLTDDIEITAVYNPVVKAVKLVMKKPSTGENLPVYAKKCEYMIQNTYDMEETYGQALPITNWSPEETSGIAAANKAYTAKVSMPFEGKINEKDMKFKVSPDLKVTAVDEDNKKIPLEVQQTDSTLSVFFKFDKTQKAKAISVVEPKDITDVKNGTSKEDILKKLDQTATINLSSGTTVDANVVWDIKDYDPNSKSVQTVTATGTLSVPDYIDTTDIKDNDGNIKVSIKIYVEGAEKVKAVEASLQDGLYIGSQTVTLSCATSDATIYYTTDGSIPTTESKQYNAEEGIEIKENTELTAIAVKDNMQDSAISSYTYTIHEHKDANGDGKCDGIIIKGADGKEEIQDCDTVFLGRSNNSSDVVYGKVKQDDGNGTIYVQVNAADILEKTTIDTNSSEEDSTVDITWKYSNEVYPMTSLKYDYKENHEATTSTSHNYIFAGWYQEDTTQDADTVTQEENQEQKSTTVLKPCTQMPKDTAYAKFVDATVLSVGAQITKDTHASSEETSMRFLTTVDGLDYQKVGFLIKYGEKTKDLSSTTVYKNVLASVGGETVAKDPSVTMKNKVSKYFMPYTITHIKQSAFENAFVVTPYWITSDGTKVCGSTTTKKVCNAPGYSDN